VSERQNPDGQMPQAARSLMEIGDELVDYRYLEPTAPPVGRSVEEMDIANSLRQALVRSGIERLYEFQERTIRLVLAGEDVVISAPTASGKTQAFTIPIYQRILDAGISRGIHALLVYPNKTLSRDQLTKLREIALGTGIRVAVYDGDTERGEREVIRADPPQVLITNFDMIHYHLSRNTGFARLISGTRFVVIDEIHTYKGAFGSNVHLILQRMRRSFGHGFQIIGASATIANPREFATELFGTRPRLVRCDEGKHGGIHFLMLSPADRSDRTMLADVLGEAVRNGMKTVLFANSHKGVESMAQIARERVGVDVAVHRAGISYQHRREVEAKLRSGRIKGVISTPTLELGIDIGDLDAVASELVGITSFKQRIGRVARRGQQGLAVLGLRSEDPISSYYRNHPDDYFRDVEPGYCEPGNPVVARHQLLSASMDRPILEDEFPEYRDVIEDLLSDGLLERGEGILRPTARGRDTVERYSIRGMGQRVLIVHQGERIGFREMPLAARELHPGAVYLHAGETYRSISFSIDTDPGYAEVVKTRSKRRIRTEPKRESSPEIVEVLGGKTAFGVEVLYCRLRIRERVEGYYTIDIYRNKITGRESLEDPIDYSFTTLGLVFRAPDPERASKAHLTGSFHAVEHVLIESSDMLTGGGKDEVGGVAIGDTGVIFAYDGAPGGSGISRLLYDRFEEGVRRAHSLLSECKCGSRTGCPNCTFSYRCGNNNEPLDRLGAMDSLGRMLRGDRTEVPEMDYGSAESVV